MISPVLCPLKFHYCPDGLLLVNGANLWVKETKVEDFTTTTKSTEIPLTLIESAAKFGRFKIWCDQASRGNCFSQPKSQIEYNTDMLKSEKTGMWDTIEDV